ncbi:MAG: sulfite exporter TauE/SafE family protein [Fluviibacter sp.]
MSTSSTALPIFAAVLIGWLGGVHCLGMCGGIVSALSMSVPEGRRPALLLAYNLGRCFTYILLGALAGFMGYAGISVLGVAPLGFYILANILQLVWGSI